MSYPDWREMTRRIELLINRKIFHVMHDGEKVWLIPQETFAIARRIETLLTPSYGEPPDLLDVSEKTSESNITHRADFSLKHYMLSNVKIGALCMTECLLYLPPLKVEE